jgi:nucleotide-binding universal stress UspA family protein
VPGVILAVLEHPAATGTLLSAAQRLAVLSGAAHINAMVVRAPPETMLPAGTEALPEQQEAAFRAEEASRVARVRTVFDRWAAAQPSGVDARWIDIDGIAELLVEERGSRADFIVIERPMRHGYATDWRALRAALFATDRPILVMPRHCATDFGRRVAIAWRDDRGAAKAVLSALRCLPECTDMFVLAGARDGDAPPKLPPILTEHGIAAALHLLNLGSGTLGAALLRKAHELGADMLVMGAYQHTPLREFLLGGVTRHVLNHAHLPVLLRH